MSRKHLFVIAVLLGAATVAGLLALTRTTTAASRASDAQIAARSRSLDRLEASLRRSLAEQPPARLPAAVTFAPDTADVRQAGTSPAQEDEDEHDHDDDERADEAYYEDEDADD